jgi:hypothetical protein
MLNPASAKCRIFRNLRQLLYVIALDMLAFYLKYIIKRYFVGFCPISRYLGRLYIEPMYNLSTKEEQVWETKHKLDTVETKPSLLQLIKHETMKECGELLVCFHAFITSVLDGGE